MAEIREIDPKITIYDIKGVSHIVNIADITKLVPGKITLANGYTIKILEDPKYIEMLANLAGISDKIALE